MANLIESDKLINKINLNVNSSSNSFSVLLCTSQEVCDLIKKSRNKKSKRSLDIETRFIMYANPVSSVYLSKLFNLCVKETYPDSLKIAEVIQFLKKDIVTKPLTIVRSHSCPNLTKFSKICYILNCILIRPNITY